MEALFMTCITLEGDQHAIEIVQIEQIVMEGARCASSFDRDEPLFFVIDTRSNLIVSFGNYADCDEWVDSRSCDNPFVWERYEIVPVEERMS